MDPGRTLEGGLAEPADCAQSIGAFNETGDLLRASGRVGAAVERRAILPTQSILAIRGKPSPKSSSASIESVARCIPGWTFGRTLDSQHVPARTATPAPVSIEPSRLCDTLWVLSCSARREGACKPSSGYASRGAWLAIAAVRMARALSQVCMFSLASWQGRFVDSLRYAKRAQGMYQAQYASDTWRRALSVGYP